MGTHTLAKLHATNVIQTRIIVQLVRGRNLPTKRAGLDDDRSEARTGGVDGGRQAGGASAYDHKFMRPKQ